MTIVILRCNNNYGGNTTTASAFDNVKMKYFTDWPVCKVIWLTVCFYYYYTSMNHIHTTYTA